MLGTILERLITLGVLCHIFAEGKDILQLYKPNPDLPQELNDFLDKVQAHRDDFALIRNIAKKEKKLKDQSGGKFSLRNEMEEDFSDDSFYERPVRSYVYGSLDQHPGNDIYPYMYQKKVNDPGNTWNNYPNEQFSKDSSKNSLRLRRGLDLSEDINIKPTGQIGEVKRSGEKFPDRNNLVKNIEKSRNGEQAIAENPTKNDKKREIEIDVKSDGMLIKKIKEDNRDSKSIVLNIESQNRAELAKPILFNQIPVNIPLNLQKKSTDIKTLENNNNYFNLVTLTDNLNSDKTLTVVEELNIPTENSVLSSNLYMIEKNNYNKNLDRLNSEAISSSMISSRLKNRRLENDMNLLNPSPDNLEQNQFSSNFIPNKHERNSENFIIEKDLTKVNRNKDKLGNNADDVGFEKIQGIFVSATSTEKKPKEIYHKRMADTPNIRTGQIGDFSDTNYDGNFNFEYTMSNVPVTNFNEPRITTYYEIPFPRASSPKYSKVEEFNNLVGLGITQNKEKLQRFSNKNNHKQYSFSGEVDVVSQTENNEKYFNNRGEVEVETLESRENNRNPINEISQNGRIGRKEEMDYKKGDIAIDYNRPNKKIKKFNQSHSNPLHAYLHNEIDDDEIHTSIDTADNDADNIHLREKRIKNKPKKHNKKRKRKKKKRKYKKHKKHRIHQSQNKDQTEQKISNSDYYTYFIDPSNDYDSIPAFKSRKLHSNSDEINEDEVNEISSSSPQFAPVFLFQRHSPLEGDDSEEEDPLSEKVTHKNYQKMSETVSEDYDDDDDYSKPETYKEKSSKNLRKIAVKAEQETNLNSNKKNDLNIGTTEETNKILTETVLELKDEDRANVAHGHGKHKSKPLKNLRTKKNKTKKSDVENQNLFLKYNPEFQQWPKFANSRRYKDRKRSLQNNIAIPLVRNFPLSSEDFFMIPKERRRLRKHDIKREDTNVQLPSTNQPDTSIAITGTLPAPTAAQDEAGGNSLGETSTEIGITQPENVDDACSKQELSSSGAICEEENFNRTVPVQLNTVLPFIKESKTAEPVPLRSNNTEEFENFINLDNILTGKLPANILTGAYRFAPSKVKSRLRKGSLNMHLNFTTPANSTESLKIMHQITKLMSQLQQHAFCQPLSTTLRIYVKHITQTPQEDVLIKVRTMEEAPVDENQKPYVFQSHQGDNLENKMAVLKDLLNQYARLPDKCKERAEPVKEYIENHLGMLDNMMSSSNTSSNHTKSAVESMKSAHNATRYANKKEEDNIRSGHESNYADQSKSKKSLKPVPSIKDVKETINNNEQLILEQLESLGLGRKHEFKPKFDLDQMVELNKYNGNINKKKSSSTKQPTRSTKSVGKRQIDQQDDEPLIEQQIKERLSRSPNVNSELSNQYKKLQAAVSKIKLKKDREKRLATIYGQESQDGLAQINNVARAEESGFEAPLVVSF